MVAAAWATIHREEASVMSQKISILGIDIAKLVFHVVGMDHTGHVVLRKRMATVMQRKIPEFLKYVVPCHAIDFAMDY